MYSSSFYHISSIHPEILLLNGLLKGFKSPIPYNDNKMQVNVVVSCRVQKGYLLTEYGKGNGFGSGRRQIDIHVE